MSFITPSDEEKTTLQTDTNSTANLVSLHDLRTLYYQSEVGTLLQKDNDLIREYLLRQTQAVGVFSLYDLWRLFMVSRGVTNQVSIGDMFAQFFANSSYIDPALDDQPIIFDSLTVSELVQVTKS